MRRYILEEMENGWALSIDTNDDKPELDVTRVVFPGKIQVLELKEEEYNLPKYLFGRNEIETQYTGKSLLMLLVGDWDNLKNKLINKAVKTSKKKHLK